MMKAELTQQSHVGGPPGDHLGTTAWSLCSYFGLKGSLFPFVFLLRFRLASTFSSSLSHSSGQAPAGSCNLSLGELMPGSEHYPPGEDSGLDLRVLRRFV